MKIIIVDDEYETLEEIRSLVLADDKLEMMGTFLNPLEALEFADKHEPDGALIDIQMPAMSGIELAEQLLNKYPKMQIGFITAYNHYATEAFDVGAIDYILKPVHPHRFEKTIQRMLGQYQQKEPLQNSSIRIQSFGVGELLVDETPIKWNRSKSREIFFYLLCHMDRKKNKFVICDALWPDCDPQKALMNLQTAVYSLRKTLGVMQGRNVIIEYINDCYQMHVKELEWDFLSFQQLFFQVKETGNLNCARQAVELYRGDFLEGEDWSWKEPFAIQIWGDYLHLLNELAVDAEERQDWKGAYSYGTMIFNQQPFDSVNQIRLIKAYSGEYGTAAIPSLVSDLTKRLKKEYDTELDIQTIQYMENIGINPA